MFLARLQKNFKVVNALRGAVLLLGVVLPIAVLSQSTDDYLKQLEGEASGLTLDEKTQTGVPVTQSSPAASGVGSSGGAGEFVGGLPIERFEQALQQNFMGSYLFYKRLTNTQKGEIFGFYQQNPDPDAVRAKILQVSKQ